MLPQAALFLFALILLTANTSIADEKIRVVTSIRPIQLIVNEIMGEAGEADLLIETKHSPHHFQLKPSHLKKIADTDLLIWISSHFEAGLDKLQHSLPDGSERLELIRENRLIEQIEDSDQTDGHIWLSPDILITINQLISDKLAQLDPLNQPLYESNRKRLNAKLRHWKRVKKLELGERDPGYILDHPFLHYFEKTFAQSSAGSLRNNHDQVSSIRHLTKLHDELKREPVKCLLVSQLPVSAQASQISRQYDLRIIEIDTMGSALKNDSIIDLLDGVFSAVKPCLV